MNLVSNYGLFWRRDMVAASSVKAPGIGFEAEWPRTGQLRGVGVRKKRQGMVDFAEQRGIYALYDEQFRLVYVGQVGRSDSRLYKRLRVHTRSVLSERWSRFSWFGIMPVAGSNEEPGLVEVDELKEINVTMSTILDHIEAVLILAGEPLRNKKGGIFGPNVTHYRQYKGAADPEDVGGDETGEA